MNLDLISKAVIPGSDYWCESGYDDTVFSGRSVVKVGQDVAMCAVLCPVFTMLLPSFVSFCSDVIGNGFPRKQEITLNAGF